MMAAAGIKDTAQPNTIGACIAYDRVQEMDVRFDKRLVDRCKFLAENRNSELHSGASPATGLVEESWLLPFWKAASLMLEVHTLSLSDWVGPAEAGRVAKVVADNSELVKQNVNARIERYRANYNRAGFKSFAAQNFHAQSAARRYEATADDVEPADCPACGGAGNLLGFDPQDEVLDTVHETDLDGYVDGGYEIVEITYSVCDFRCHRCGLPLVGPEQVEAAGLPLLFTREETRDPCYEAEFGDE